jgi:CDP-glycerol glycerophosphotransferase
MASPAVSIIIPCYNIQQFIEKAVNSIWTQTFQNYEMILVNDGSTDNTLEALKVFAAKDKRIKLVDKSNGGLSSARNAGMDAASGEYIIFLDGDDWLLNNALETLYQKSKKEDLDVLIADTLFYHSNEQIHWVYKRPDFFNTLGIQNGIDYFVELKRNYCYAPMSVNQIYRCNFLKKNNLQFQDGLINEDELWTPQVLLKAQRVNCIEFPFYYYLQRDNSIMNSKINSKKILDNIYIANTLINLTNNQGNTELKGWMWVKSYELYFRAITEYKAPKIVLNQINHSNYTIFKLLIAKVPELQFDWCLKYLKSSNKNSIDLLIYLSFRRVFRKIKKILGL